MVGRGRGGGYYYFTLQAVSLLWWNVRGPASGPALACERVVGLSDMNNTADSTALATDYAERCTERAIP